jgi:hypothetical protein
MDFLYQCADRLERGEEGKEVMQSMKERYSTLRCVSSKASKVRELCRPTAEFVAAVETLLEEKEELRPKRESLLHGKERVAGLPPRLPPSASSFKLSREEARECKRRSLLSRLSKNARQKAFDGRAILRSAREVLSLDREQGGPPLVDLAHSLMLLTGRRTCEVLNGVSEVRPHSPHSLLFRGQAKKRGERGEGEYVIPCLADSESVCRAWEWAREKAGRARSNEETSRRYQSELRRSRLRKEGGGWESVTKTHQLRGLYACMCVRLFDWKDRAPAYVTMCILGHSGLDESLVYTPFSLGEDFCSEERLGEGHLTEHHHLIATGTEAELG